MAQSNTPVESEARQRTLRIGVAEDYVDLRATLIKMLRAMGHTIVCEVENGQQLLDALGDQPIDLVLMDLDMPVLDGLATAELLAARRRVPVLLMSGHPDMSHVVADKEPISGCLRKPISVDKLREAIDLAVPPVAN